MGSINHYFCNHCDEDQIAYHGIGMMYPINKIDIRVFGCYDCGIVYNGNINKDSLCRPKCKKEALELNFHNKMNQHPFNALAVKPVNSFLKILEIGINNFT